MITIECRRSIIPPQTLAVAVTSLLAVLFTAGPAQAAADAQPWTDKSISVEQRTRLLLNAMTLDEKRTLVFGYFSSDAPWKNFKKPPEGVPQSAGFVPGVARLNIPAQKETDAGIGVASQPGEHPTAATALPSGIALAATWDPQQAFAGAQMIGNEARLRGFNVMLAGGVNLTRDPRGGRTFEYAGEDPWLAANMVAAEIRGIQSNHIISTIKHFAFNDQETSRSSLDVRIAEPAARMSDLLAFEIAIEQSQPGAVMCSYNRVRTAYACENDWLLNQTLKRDWGFPGFVMSDWGGTHSTIPAANAGLDQESGYPFDVSPYFADALKEAVVDGHVPSARLDDMAGRILHSLLATGAFDDPSQPGDIDFAAHAAITRAAAEASIVLLKNDQDVLPLKKQLRSIAIIGSHADAGVLSGGGSSQVYPPEGTAVLEKQNKPFPRVYFSSSPLKSLAAQTRAQITYDDGSDAAKAASLASQSDVAIVFAHQWTAEGIDNDLRLEDSQDALITAVARANPKTVVVLETGGPVLMPWFGQVAAVLEAWYPGSQGGTAIARILSGAVNPGGHLPVTFPASIDQLPRQALDTVQVDYDTEGAAVGYKWFAQRNLQPLLPFGYGLSYTRFNYSALSAKASGNRVSVRFKVRNAGAVRGKAVPQIYVAPEDPEVTHLWQAPKRLGAFRKVDLRPGAAQELTVDIDPRLLAGFDSARHDWVVTEGNYTFTLATDVNTPVATATIHLGRLPLAVR